MRRKSGPKTIAILGAGGRGMGFAKLIGQFPHLGRVVAVAEPRPDYRKALAGEWSLPASRQFKTWQDFVARPPACDAVVVTTMDRDHVGPAVACLERGLDLLLEKPMATSLEDCRAIEAAQRRSGAIVAVCHSLRYHKGFRAVRDLVASGAVGRVVTMDQIESVSHWHQAHSFVRGNWGNEGRSSCMLLAKSCHDVDYMAYVIGKPCRRVSSFGHLSFFRAENAPPGSPARCTEGCPVEAACTYSAYRRYVYANRAAWPANVISLDHSVDAHLAAIRTGPYGRCVFHCDNDVVDHQVVAMEFADDVTATFTMTAFATGGRRLRVNGTAGEIRYEEDRIRLHTFADGDRTEIAVGTEEGGHGGGDTRVMREWLTALHTRDDAPIVANAQESLRTHTIVFAAERSRREGRTVELGEM